MHILTNKINFLVHEMANKLLHKYTKIYQERSNFPRT